MQLVAEQIFSTNFTPFCSSREVLVHQKLHAVVVMHQTLAQSLMRRVLIHQQLDMVVMVVVV